MTAATSLYYYNDQLGKVDPRQTELWLSISGAKTSAMVVPNSVALTGYDAAAFPSQAAIDAFLGTTNEFLLAAFDSTSMGTDAFALIVNMQGQVKTLVSAQIVTYTGTAGVTASSLTMANSSALTSSSLSSQAAKGANGNVAVRTVVSGMDGFTSGLIKVVLNWISK